MILYPRGRFQVWLCDPTGRRVALVPQASITSLSYSVQNPTQQTGQLTVNVPRRYDELAVMGAFIEIWRSPLPGLAPRHEGTYILESRSYLPFGRRVWSGDHANKLLKFRMVDADRGEARADKTGPADNLIKQYTRENGGTAVLAAARDFNQSFPFYVEADYGLAPVVTKEAGRANLLDTVQQLQKASQEQEPSPRWLMWEVTPIGLDLQFALELRTWVDYRRNMGTWSSSPMILDEHNCLADVRREEDYRNVLTHVVVGGQGTGASRTEKTVEDTRQGPHATWWRREGYVDGGQTTDGPTMQEKGYRKLREGQPLDRFTARLRPHPSFAYGLTFFVGDLLGVRVGRLWNVRIEGVTVTSDGHNEQVDVKMEVAADA